MRTLKRNQQNVHYALYVGKTEKIDSNGYRTGQYVTEYTEPTLLKAVISANRGEASQEMFGINTNYSRTMITEDMRCPIDENSIIWIDKPTEKPHNYVVVQVAKGLNSIAYALREVIVSA